MITPGSRFGAKGLRACRPFLCMFGGVIGWGFGRGGLRRGVDAAARFVLRGGWLFGGRVLARARPGGGGLGGPAGGVCGNFGGEIFGSGVVVSCEGDGGADDLAGGVPREGGHDLVAVALGWSRSPAECRRRRRLTSLGRKARGKSVMDGEFGSGLSATMDQLPSAARRGSSMARKLSVFSAKGRASSSVRRAWAGSWRSRWIWNSMT